MIPDNNLLSYCHLAAPSSSYGDLLAQMHSETASIIELMPKIISLGPIILNMYMYVYRYIYICLCNYIYMVYVDYDTVPSALSPPQFGLESEAETGAVKDRRERREIGGGEG